MQQCSLLLAHQVVSYYSHSQNNVTYLLRLDRALYYSTVPQIATFQIAEALRSCFIATFYVYQGLQISELHGVSVNDIHPSGLPFLRATWSWQLTTRIRDDKMKLRVWSQQVKTRMRTFKKKSI